MNKGSKLIQYQALIILSAVDAVAGLTALIYGLYLALFGTNKTAVFESQVNQVEIWIRSASIWGCFIFAAACFVAYPFLTKKRQALRDEVEYDENGVSRKKGSFSQLSKAERDEIERQQMIDRERLLPSSQLKSITHEGPADPEAELDKLIGLKQVKLDVKQIEARMRYEAELNAKNKKGKNKKGPATQTLSSSHMIFFGPPGTGKTTVARIMAGILYKYGYIRKNQCIEVDGNFFNGLSTGESSKRVAMLIKASLGGVLFIDEAYSLLSLNGQEVIATIVAQMENHRDDLVIIFAGYEKEMLEFIDSNPGIESRVKHKMYFESYNTEEIKEIFTSMANINNLCVTSGLLDKVAIRVNEMSKDKNFGNARTIRNLLDKIIDKHALNLVNGQLDAEDRFILRECDLLRQAGRLQGLMRVYQ